MRQVRHFIDSEYIESASGAVFDKVAPATGAVVARVHEAGRDEVDRAVSSARRALKGEWGRLGLEQRC